MKTDYRGLVRTAHARARAALATGEPSQLACAALHTRMAMEGLTYERAQAYAEDLPPATWQHWQPKKIMDVLLQIDPLADQGGTLSMGIEETPGVPAKKMTLIGTEHVLSMKQLRAHYDRLGAFLHLPTPRQIQEGKEHDWTKVRRRCEEVLEEIERALRSPLHAAVFRLTTELGCLRCGERMRRRIPIDEDFEVEVECFECYARYRVSGAAQNSQVRWLPLKQPVACPTEGCSQQHAFWESEIKPGLAFQCQECHGKFELILGVVSAVAPDTREQKG
jgi:hypothetical protein